MSNFLWPSEIPLTKNKGLSLFPISVPAHKKQLLQFEVIWDALSVVLDAVLVQESTPVVYGWMI